MHKESIATKLLSGFFQFLIAIAFLWGEFGGIYHAFKHHGKGDGFAAVFIPPYGWYRSIDYTIYLIKGGGLTESEKGEIGHWIDSLKYGSDARDLLNKELEGTVGFVTIDEKIETKIKGLLENSLKESQNVRDAVLSKLNPDLPGHYRNEYCESLRNILQGWEEEDIKKQVMAQALLDKWIDWYNNHVDDIRKIYSKD